MHKKQIVQQFVQFAFLSIYLLMEIASYSNFRQNLKSFLEKVISTRDPLYVTQRSGKDVVVISKEEFEGMQETVHLLSSPKNSQRLLEGIDQYNSGQTVTKTLGDLDE